MPDAKPAIGFIGLGIMGSPMAANLIKAGFPVTGYDHHQTNLDKLVAAGGTAVGSEAEAAAGADIVVTMLPDSPQVAGAVLGEGGVFETFRSRQPGPGPAQPAQPGGSERSPAPMLIDFSTIKPETSREIAEAGAEIGVVVLDAPVSGGETGAIEGTLSIMVGGNEADFEAANPVFEAVGGTYRLVGPHGAGQVVKAANQLVVGGTYALVAEAIVLMEASGVDAAAGLDVLAGGLAASRILDLKRKSMLAREFRPGFRIDLHHKDMGIALAAARNAEVPVPMTGLVAQLIAAAQALGYGSLDHSALLSVTEVLSGRGQPPAGRDTM